MQDNLSTKQKQFNLAMDMYESRKVYKVFGKFISIINVSLQILLAVIIFPQNIGLKFQIIAFVLAYIFADLINGLVHMYMDNNENYESIAGPLIASFHLHHHKPLYKKNNIFLVYFNESGSKIWLAGFLIITIFSLFIFNINPIVLYTIFYFSVISCIAEVSHYLCHVSNSKVVDLFRKTGLLLGKRHHGRHHIEDNVNYGFLNGMTDPIINLVAKKFYKGYKTGTDTHYMHYHGKGTNNR